VDQPAVIVGQTPVREHVDSSAVRRDDSREGGECSWRLYSAPDIVETSVARGEAMSGISNRFSLQHFLDAASQSKSGEIRVNAGTEDRIVNKGTLGNRIATKLNINTDEETRLDRGATARQRFRDALVDRYGEKIGGHALSEAMRLALRHEDASLTGAIMLKADKLARQMEDDHRAGHQQTLADKAYDGDDEKLGAAYNERFRQTLGARTHQFERSYMHHDPDWKPETEDDPLRELQSEVAEQVAELAALDRLDDSNKARAALAYAMQGVLVTIANGAPPDVLLARLERVDRWQRELQEIEGQVSPQTGEEKLLIAATEALDKLKNQYDIDFAIDLRMGILSPSSALRAIHDEAKRISEDDRRPESERTQAGRLLAQTEQIVQALAPTTTLTTELRSDTVQLFAEGTVEEKQVGIAREALDRMLGTDDIPISQFVDYAKQAPDDEIGLAGGTLVKADPEDAGLGSGAALAKFKESLTGLYGERIANDALEHGLQGETGFTGNVVIRAEEHIPKLLEGSRDIYRQIVKEHRREGDEETATTHNRRFMQVLEARSDGFNRPLTNDLEQDDIEEQAKTLAIEVENQVTTLADRGLLEASNKARQQLDDALLDAVTAIVNRPNPRAVERNLDRAIKEENFEELNGLLRDVPNTVKRQETTFLLAKLLNVDRCLTALQEIEAKTGGQSSGEKLQIATIDAIKRFVGASGLEFFDLFDKGKLSDSSPFRALYAAAREIAENDNAPEAPRAKALMKQWERLADTFVAMTTPNTQTRTDNLKHLLEGPVDKPRLETARRELALKLRQPDET
jgi:hypothetical protein